MDEEAVVSEQQEMEEGELSDEEGSIKASATAIHSQASTVRQNNESSNNDQNGSNKTTNKEKSQKTDSETTHVSKHVKKRKHETTNGLGATEKTETETGGEINDVESYLKKRKQELAEKVKSQLRLAGIEAKIESGSDSDPECVKPDVTEKKAHPKRRILGKLDKLSVPKYYDLDKIEDPTETMISNWAKGKQPNHDGTSSNNKSSQKFKAALSPSSISEEQDPLEEYYQSSSTAAGGDSVNKTTDQDYRLMIAGNGPLAPSSNSGTAAADHDYRFNPGVDVDYRRKRRVHDHGSSSRKSTAASTSNNDDRKRVHSASGDSDDGGGGSSSRRLGAAVSSSGGGGGGGGADAAASSSPAANEFGDIDERARSETGLPIMFGNSKRSSHRHNYHQSQHSYNRSGRGQGSSNSGCSDDDMQDDRGPRFFKSGGRRGSPFRRRRMGRDDRDNYGPPGSENPPICRFYRDGYCREGDSCLFSHDVEPMPRGVNRKIELCKFYKTGYCRNGRTCPFMHGDFPCKDYHKNNDCKEGDKCRFSHDPLNDMTRPLFDKMMKEEELYTKVSMPDAPSRRKVLLGEPPRVPPPVNGPHPSMASNSVGSNDSFDNQTSYQSDSNYYDDSYSRHKPAPQHSVPSSIPPYYPSPSDQMQQSNHQSKPVKPRHYSNSRMTSQLNSSGDTVSSNSQAAVTAAAALAASLSAAAGPQVDITAMLREIKAEVKGHDIIDESPASPEPCESSIVDAAPLRQTVVRTVEYRLIPFDFPPVDAAYAQRLLKASMTDTKLSNDPRIKKMLASQFDAVSDMISSNNTLQQQQQQHKVVGSAASQQVKSRDPRLKASHMSTSPPRLVPHSPSLQQPDYPSMTPSTMGVLPFAGSVMPQLSSSNLMTGVGGMMAPPSLPHALLPTPGADTSSNATSESLALAGWMPHINTGPSIAWSGGGQTLAPAPSGPGFSSMSYPTSTGHHHQTNSFVPDAEPARDPRSRRSRHARRSSPSSASSTNFHHHHQQQQTVPSNTAQSSSTTGGTHSPPSTRPSQSDRPSPSPIFEPIVAPDSASGGGGYAPISVVDAQAAPLSLREKRKNLEYESPLGAISSSHRGGSGDENTTSCRFYGAGLKIKKKENVETSS